MKKILVIDDDKASCDFLEQVLAARGLQVTVAYDPKEGYEISKTLLPDLIFINLLLSGTNGLKVSKAVHSIPALAKVPVIMLISYEGELDPKYTVTISIVDTLVKPLDEKEIVAKTGAVLGDLQAPLNADEAIREISIEEQPEQVILLEEEVIAVERTCDEILEKAEAASKKLTRGKAGAPGISGARIKEEKSEMSQKDNPFEKKEDAFKDKDLFPEDRDLFSNELKKTEKEFDEKQPVLDREPVAPGEDTDLAYEEKPANPLRRILIITASIVAGIGLGIGGYLFFTAGSKSMEVQTQVVKVAPEPAAVPAPTGAVPEKPKVIPEIPVKPEPPKTGTSRPEPQQPGDAKQQESAAKAPMDTVKNEAVQKAEPQKPAKEAPAAAKPEVKTSEPAKKAAPAAKPGRGYYVQAGLFEYEKNAVAVAEKLKRKGFAASVRKIEKTDNKVLYRVIAGSYPDFKKAVEVSETLNKQGIKTIVHKQ